MLFVFILSRCNDYKDWTIRKWGEAVFHQMCSVIKLNLASWHLWGSTPVRDKKTRKRGCKTA